MTGTFSAMLGLPDTIKACLFDLDGVLTQTAKVHDAAWKQTFDDFLRKRADESGKEFKEFDPERDYDEYVDGKPRYDGVRSFLQSRGIALPEGKPDDPPSANTISGIGNRKNELVLKLIKQDGVEAYEGSVTYVRAARDAGLRRAVVSSSANAKDVLIAAGIEDLFEARIDGLVADAAAPEGQAGPGHVSRRRARAWRSSRRRRPCSRTRWRAFRPATMAISGSWSASTAWARPTRCASTARASSSTTSPNC